MPARRRLSASSVRRRAARLAPRAARIASSPSRRTARARTRLATLRAGDDEHEPGGREQHEQHRACPRRDLLAKQPGLDPEVGVRGIGLRVLLSHALVYGHELRARGFEVDAGGEPREELRHAVDAARDHGGREVVRARHHVGDDLGLRGIGHRRLQHPDDGGGPRAQAHRLADHRRIALERRRPEAMGQHHRPRGVRAVVPRPQQPAENGVEAHHLEVGPAHHSRAHLAGLAEAHEREGDRREVAERDEAAHALAQIHDLGHREGRVLGADAVRRLADVDEPVLVPVREGLEQHAPHQAEDGGVGPDAQGQREDHGDRQALAAPERPRREAEVLPKGHAHLTSPIRRTTMPGFDRTRRLFFACPPEKGGQPGGAGLSSYRYR